GIGLVEGLLLASLIRVTGYLALLAGGLLLGGGSTLAEVRSTMRTSHAAKGRWHMVRSVARMLENQPLLNRIVRPALRALWNLLWWPAVWLQTHRDPHVALSLDVGELTVDLRDRGVAWPLYRYGEYEPDERSVMRRLVTPGMHAIDLGAQFGYHTLLLSKLVGEAGNVLAVEAAPSNYELLVRNLEGNAATNVHAVNAAASDQPGQLQLVVDPSNFGAHHVVGESHRAGAIPVRAVQLDSIIAERSLEPRFIKIDIEGAELAALRGLTRTIEGRDLAILAELNRPRLEQQGASAGALLDYLEALGFRLYSVSTEGSLVPAGRDELVSVSTRMDNVNFLAAKGAAVARAEVPGTG
ncbi:MAG: FkbM family methyltransferase, partial [Acidimicrobiia bacterium]|nr:FkbM family methyltransferase [Acidimicrobiia bacterium]